MTTVHLNHFKTPLNVEALLPLVLKWDHCVWLKSSGIGSEGRFDIISAAPAIATDEPPSQITNLLARPVNDIDHLPFWFGWIGVAPYEQHDNTSRAHSEEPSQNLFCYYPWSFCYDHLRQEGWLILSDACKPTTRDQLIGWLKLSENAGTPSRDGSSPKLFRELNWTKSMSPAAYAIAFHKIQDYILEGDCYQANLAHRFEASHSSELNHLMGLFLNQCSTSKANFGVFFRLDHNRSLMSFSPERFISIENGEVCAQPIKGTIKVSGQLGAAEISELQSAKNRAENLMIVDLLRNDLSKSCELHSIKVKDLFQIQSFENVHHLVSTITGQLREGKTALDAFWAAFPGGSITGAPKQRAMEIIGELEQHSRSYYCGSVFYWDVRGRFDSNILIRSVVADCEKLYCWGGGGIVSDSKLESEYQESIDKVQHITGITE